MLFEFADRTMGIDGHDTFDTIGLIHLDDGTNGADVLLNEWSDFGGMFAARMKPEDFKPPHNSCVGITCRCRGWESYLRVCGIGWWVFRACCDGASSR